MNTVCGKSVISVLTILTALFYAALSFSFSLHWLYSPCSTLASFRINFPASPFLAIFLQPLTPISSDRFYFTPVCNSSTAWWWFGLKTPKHVAIGSLTKYKIWNMSTWNQHIIPVYRSTWRHMPEDRRCTLKSTNAWPVLKHHWPGLDRCFRNMGNFKILGTRRVTHSGTHKHQVPTYKKIVVRATWPPRVVHLCLRPLYDFITDFSYP